MKTGLEDKYILKNNKKLYFGYTTGSCAAASAKAGALMLFTGIPQERIDLMTPKGILLHLEIVEIRIEKDEVICAVRKNGGDDPDATHGILIYTRVKKNAYDEIRIDGGIGVGRVTKKGLEQEIGSAAINKVPRKMIRENVKKVCEDFDYNGGLDIEVFVPEGEAVAKKTFNPMLGIIGGISVLGTSGIVMPMSEAALIDSIRVEMRVKKESNDSDYLIVTPGNYGTYFSIDNLNLPDDFMLKCSNYVGETVDIALELGIRGILFVSHIGKFIKLSGGIMNTHSAFADSRMELMAANALRAGADVETAARILECINTEDAVSVLDESGLLEPAVKIILDKIRFYLDKRSCGRLETAVILFSNEYGKLGCTENVEGLLEKIKEKNGWLENCTVSELGQETRNCSP
ncbi:cobalt-precorrin-5B (C(1))-methyltransferase CbiD [Parasporobacterium paucivorans]|uniref:Cobalt-precorrin-5B C(1)-methyltransferase n=1 Tax=Parasporobacterium paucivorans DSM 15970 TaxID=1122934 RepID=A0A1M6DSX6_9FIRM|nr:cobalt-precorrin-5B (C(1))-methyltransferase CbiD [Parasporobacterium paucivorans]SHI76344.1 cobalt-precorrin 5B C1-methyltransferase [Parasporobacterium paucivorans DSM 15970]